MLKLYYIVNYSDIFLYAGADPKQCFDNLGENWFHLELDLNKKVTVQLVLLCLFYSMLIELNSKNDRNVSFSKGNS